MNGVLNGARNQQSLCRFDPRLYRGDSVRMSADFFGGLFLSSELPRDACAFPAT